MKPRLAYLLKKFPRLSETFVLNELLAQEALGRELHVFSRRPPDDEPRHPELARLRAEVEVLPPSREIDPWTALFDTGADRPGFLSRLEDVVRATRPLGHPRLPSLLTEAIVLLRRTGELGIRHVHTHFATDSAVVAMLLRELGGPTYSVTAHAKDIYRSTVDAALLDRICARASFVVTVCDANVDALTERVGSGAMARVRRLYNGVDLDAHPFSATDARDRAHVLSVGRFVEKKGFHVLVDALARLRDRGLDFEATFVGDGEQRADIERRIAAAALDDRIRLTGPLGADAVRSLLARATVFALPCVVGEDGNRDALPTVLLEALASGVPCVSTPVTGIPEILAGGEAGVLVPENDPATTADAIHALLSLPARRAEMAELGRLHAERCFDLRRQSRVLGAWLDEALDASEEDVTCASPA